MMTFIDDHRQAYGVEPTSKLSARAQRDVKLRPEIARVFTENFAVYGVRKVWRQLLREGFAVERGTVEPAGGGRSRLRCLAGAFSYGT